MLEENGPIGYWPLNGDCRDHSGHGHHGENHGVDLARAAFNGRDSTIGIPYHPSLDLGTDDFSVCAFVYTEPDMEDVIGDVFSQYDPARRRGLNLSISASSGGYNSQGNDKHVHFGIDNDRTSDWEDCGRPNADSSYVSNSLTVFDGHLYAATTDAAREEDWCHVYRYEGGDRWEDCGRVGSLRTRGAGPMVVHDGALYAATWSYDWTRVHAEPLDFCHVYRYAGARDWEDCGQPGRCLRLFGIATFRGRLYVVGDDNRCYAHEGGTTWRVCGEFPEMVHPMAVHDGRLYAGVFNASVYAYDGTGWTSLGNPLGDAERCNQIHALEVYRGRLHATTWPEGRVAVLEESGEWVECGRLGDSTEINGLTVYNGKLYAGTIPRAEVYRYEGGSDWTRLQRFFAPEGWEPIPVAHDPSLPDARERVAEWTRVTSLTVYEGRLFAGIGSCTSARQDAPCDVRGKVFAMQAGRCVSYDRDLGPGWQHLVVVRNGNRLELTLNAREQVISPPFNLAEYHLSNGQPMKIGGGEQDVFSGKIREVRLYRRALRPAEIERLYHAGRSLIG